MADESRFGHFVQSRLITSAVFWLCGSCAARHLSCLFLGDDTRCGFCEGNFSISHSNLFL